MSDQFKRLTPSEYEALPWVVVRGSNYKDGHARITILGTENGLREVIKCCEQAIERGKSKTVIYHAGGEGSGIEAMRTNLAGFRAHLGDDADE